MQIFNVIIFFRLHTIQQKTVKPTYLCPFGARKLAEGKGHQIDHVFELSLLLWLSLASKMVLADQLAADSWLRMCYPLLFVFEIFIYLWKEGEGSCLIIIIFFFLGIRCGQCVSTLFQTGRLAYVYCMVSLPAIFFPFLQDWWAKWFQ